MVRKKIAEKLSKSALLNKINEGLSGTVRGAVDKTEPAEEKCIEHKEGQLCYSAKGDGMPVVLLHGFLEDKTVWQPFSDKLSEAFRVIALDLPGHGDSGLLSESAGPKVMAKAAAAVLDAEEIEKAFVIGHSMGGYAACAFADLFPERLSALCLFHSIPRADSADKKNARNEAIQRINDGEKEALCREHAPKVFAEQNVKKFAAYVERNTHTALSMKPEAIKATLRGMRDRSDYSLTIKELNLPFLYIEGKYDHFIPQNSMSEADFPKEYEYVIFEKSGHIGFLEEEKEALQVIKTFGQKAEKDEP